MAKIASYVANKLIATSDKPIYIVYSPEVPCMIIIVELDMKGSFLDLLHVLWPKMDFQCSLHIASRCCSWCGCCLWYIIYIEHNQ